MDPKDGTQQGNAPTTAATPPASNTAPAQAAPSVDPAALKTAQDALAAEQAARKALEAKLAEVTPAIEKFNKVSELLGGKEKDPAEELPALQSRATQAEQAARQARAENVLFRLAAKSDAADPDDVVMALAGKVEFAADGKVNEAAAKLAIDELLKSKPHWRRAQVSPAAVVQAAGAPLPTGTVPTATPAPTTKPGTVTYTEHDLRHGMNRTELRKVRDAFNASRVH